MKRIEINVHGRRQLRGVLQLFREESFAVTAELFSWTGEPIAWIGTPEDLAQSLSELTYGLVADLDEAAALTRNSPLAIEAGPNDILVLPVQDVFLLGAIFGDLKTSELDSALEKLFVRTMFILDSGGSTGAAGVVATLLPRS